ncbi:restriction endonuclease [Streptomyces poriferorum]|uniref:Restriction endonuclease n=1 Tax=Streptomyces poriferorum TaxID=2798799 RepID=A0ABY9IIU9_9ACTN|nr:MULTISPECIES: restriction endonuclease [unclassified Streptomyces]MDP5316769.1 restriction endonuclease [Streptomyces sp. Alt4]WLQ55065.1 restriction endonuclease [Streptomyces sp. Alt2]
MTAPVPERGLEGCRQAFSVSRTAFGFGAVALLICGGWLMVRIVWEGASRHPVAVVPVVALVAAGVLLLHLRGPSPRPRGVRGPLSEAVHELFGPPRGPSEPVREPFGHPHDDDIARTAVLAGPEPEPAESEEELADYAALDADAFEDAVAALCERDGCSEVQVVGGAGDLGADVIATAPDGRRMVVQCKCYSPATKVGSQDLQRFGGTCYAVHEAEIAVCVTTSAYTGPALDYADQCGIQCLDGEALSAWSEGSAPPPWQTDPGP